MSTQAGGGPGSRREAREQALTILYEADIKAISPADVLSSLDYDPSPFAQSLILGVSGSCEELDAVIERRAIGWRVARMPVIDRTLLRVGTYELLQTPDVPTAVVISEAVELAKRYSTDDSGRFVNGVLAAIAADTDASPDG